MPRNKEEKHANGVLIRLNKTLDILNTFLSEFNDSNDNLYQELISRKNNLIEIYNRAEILVEELDTNSDLIAYSDEVFLKYHSILIKAEVIVSKRKNINSNCEAKVSSRNNSNITLPEIKLPFFAGEILLWYQFRDLFQSIIINSTNITNSAKFCYLMGCLKGEAKALLQNLEISDDNFSVAWSMLKNRYDSPRLLVSQHLNCLLNPPSFVSDSPSSLQNLIDFFRLHTNALQALRKDTDLADLLLSALVTKNLPKDMLKVWELSLKDDALPSFDSLMSFLETQQRSLNIATQTSSSSQSNDDIKLDNNIQSKSYKCPKCQLDHFLKNCPEFLNLTPKDRATFVTNTNRCIRCLNIKRETHSCNVICDICNKMHNKLLHFTNKQSSTSKLIPVAVTNSQVSNNILLPTAQIKCFNDRGQPCYLNALLDTGSGVNLISADVVEALKLPTRKCNINISSVTQDMIVATRIVQLNVFSCHTQNPWTSNINFVVVPKIPTTLSSSFNDNFLKVPNNLFLADPLYNHSKTIHVLLGADIFFDILLPTRHVKRNEVFPILQETKLGWILAGKTPLNINKNSDSQFTTCTFIQSNFNLPEQIKNFWEIEEINPTKAILLEHEHAEHHFEITHSRDSLGRYIVRLPIKQEIKSLGHSKAQAIRRLVYLEKRFETNISLKNQYQNFMNEYLNLKHMCIAPPFTMDNAYYIPHHAVLKPSSTTTKLRVVFDASAKTSKGNSLNDILINGNKLQDDIFDILIRFRIGKIGLISDLEKMFRQINLNPLDWHFQHILWRNSPKEEIKDYVLNTVTYGLKPATFLAVRTLHQLADDECKEFPVASSILKGSFYVDDLLYSCMDINTATTIVSDLNSLLAKGGFTLRKWCSNYPDVLAELPKELLAQNETKTFENKAFEFVNTLGVSWHTKFDTLALVLPKGINFQTSVFTKRKMLSIISGLFDPLGIAAPCIVLCKLLFQKLWQYSLSWDDIIPPEIDSEWKKVYSNLSYITDIRVPRCIVNSNNNILELHGFSDSSSIAYGAVIYLKAIHNDRESVISLLCAKSKVVPSHFKCQSNDPLTIPRLELCAATLLTKLMCKVKNIILKKEVIISNTIFWCDSTIVLDWISKPPLKGNIFVRNRTQYIREHTVGYCWKHVNSTSNPADLLTRGILAKQLMSEAIWLTGPSFLKFKQNLWPSTHEVYINSIISTPCIPVTSSYLESRICNYYSSLNKIYRVMSYVIRFVDIARKKYNISYNFQNQLSVSEINNAELVCVKIVQQASFYHEWNSLCQQSLCPVKSKLISLNPFLHTDGCIRLGGRLQEANLTFQSMHPLILPSSHPFVTALIFDTHKRLAHAGPQLIISFLRQKFWILSVRRTIKSVLKKCVICFRHHPITAHQLMGSLPAVRVQQNDVFRSVGIDYTGYFLVKSRGIRSKFLSKVYLILFICMATRAIHIEIVSDLTTNAFLMALKRFIARRGLPNSIYSDNASAFLGAKSKLNALFELLESSTFKQEIQNFCSTSRIQWHFTIPNTPHTAGFWEVNIKSLKYHLIRIMGNQSYTYEELLSLSVQIEAILNSRPLSKLSDDSSEFDYLTPGHFLIGRPLTALPDPQFKSHTGSHLSRWKDHQKKMKVVWQRWSHDYLHTLQQRFKWNVSSPNIKIGIPVLLVEDNLNPLVWKMGIITQLFPGNDNYVRTIQVKTKLGFVIKHVRKVCPLPIS